jgi:hypothetical protein
MVVLSCMIAVVYCQAVGSATESAPSTVEARIMLPESVVTFDDGRRPIGDLFAEYQQLLDQGWKLDLIINSRPTAALLALPIIALRSPAMGPAVWFLTGIHGEEPAGPNAIAATIDSIAALGKCHPVLLLPMLNPHGYARNWRYLNTPAYSVTVEGHSVGDSSHLLPDQERPDQPRAAALSPEAEAITAYLLEIARTYPPRYSIDLHEDNLIDEGYVYSQGVLGARDPLASEAVRILRHNNMGVKMSGQTRFGEEIAGGIIGPVTDSSIDELISARHVLVNGQPVSGPGAETVLVFETPADNLTLSQRVNAHADLIRQIAARIGQCK